MNHDARFTAAAPRTDTNESLQYLRAIAPEGPWVLTSIFPDAKTTTTKTFDANDEQKVRKWIETENQTKNIHPTGNLCGRPTKKPKKAQITGARYLHTDDDPRDGETPDEAKRRILAIYDDHEAPPSIVVDSGNGLQGYWLFKEDYQFPELKLTEPTEPQIKDRKNPTSEEKEKLKVYNKELKAYEDEVEDRVAAIENRNIALAKSLGTQSGTHNVDRLLRLPGTINHPNAKKRNAGRVACQSSIVRITEARYSLDDFPAVINAEKTKTSGDNTRAIEMLPVSERIKNLIHGIDDPNHNYNSRSERVMAVLTAMAAAECTDEEMAICGDPAYPISAHVLDQKAPEKYLARQITEARKKAADPRVAKLNEDYALVLVGDKAAIMNTSVAEGIKMLTVSAFGQWFANQHIPYKDKKGNEKQIPLAEYWLHHRQRRQYEGIVFAPQREVLGHYNLWKGFSVEPRPGDCSKFLAHLKDNVCQGSDNLCLWVVGWFAQIVQHPEEKMGTSLVFRGKQGVGKTKVGEVFGSLLNNHYALVSDPRYVIGRFNSHLVSCLLLHCDEAFWAGDHAAEGKVKDLITGNYQFIEFKGKEVIKVLNYVRLLVTGNPDWLVPAGFEERRFAVLDVGEVHMQDHPYFAAIDAEMNNGGREALLHHLLNFDLSTVNLREIPKTAALVDQKLSSLNPEHGWWLDLLMRGELPGGCEEDNTCPATRLFDSYINHADQMGVRRRSIETRLGIFLGKMVTGLRRFKGTYDRAPTNGKGIEGYVYILPPLGECRAAFAKAMQHEILWRKQDEWTKGPDGKF